MRVRALLLSMSAACALALPVGAGEIRGRLWHAGKPLSGVTVSAVPFETPLEQARREARAQDAPSALASATTRADGTFTLPLSGPTLTAGTALRLKLSGAGVAAALLAGVFDAGEDHDVGDVLPMRSAALVGKVLDSAGAPVKEAKVTIWPGAAQGPSLLDSLLEPLAVTVMTGADGSFKLENAADGGNRVRAEAPGRALVELHGVRKGALRAPIVMPPGRTVEGVVMRADRRTPAGGIVVRFQGKVTSPWVETAADGSFRVAGLPGGDGLLMADGGTLGGASVPLPEKGKATLALAPWATIAGRVVDARSGAPVTGIRLVARTEGGTFFTRSGAGGRYALAGLPAGEYRLSADDARYVPWTADAVRAAPGATVARDAALTASATLTGRVVDERGAPVADARGVLSPVAMKSFREMMRQMGPGASGAFRSGPDGTFRATRLPPGDSHKLTVSHEEYEPRTVGLALLPGSANPRLTVVLRRGLTLVGVVKDQADQPIAGVDVNLFRMQSMQNRRGSMRFMFGGMEPIPKQTSGPDGRFLFRGLAASEYQLSARKPGYGEKRVDAVVIAEGRNAEPLEVVLSQGATISGFVRDATGQAVEGQRVMARPSGAGMQGAMIVTEELTGPDGGFLVEGLGAGESYDLQLISSMGGVPQRTGVVAPAEGIELTTPSSGGLAGTVTEGDGERPVPEYSVTYRPAGVSGGMSFSFSGPGKPSGPGVPVAVQAADGKFRIAAVPPGKWNVEVKADGYLDGHAAAVTVEEGRTTEGVDLRLARGATLRGRALEADTSRPLVDVQVRARLQGDPRHAYSFPFDEGGLRATSDADGRFELKGLAAGSYAVTGTHPDHAEASETVAVKEQPVGLDLRLGRGTALAGGVVAGGRPVAGASVDLAAAGADTNFGSLAGENVMTGEGGRFRFDHLRPGRYTLTASLRSESSPPLEVVVQAGQGREDLVLTLGTGAVIHGRVLGLPEDALLGLWVNASGPDGFQANTRTSAGGTFEIAGVPPGPISLGATSGDFMRSTRNASTQVTVAEGQTELNAELRFEPGFRLSGHVTQGGQPLVNMIVGAWAEGGGRPGATSRTDDDGAYVLDGLVTGKYNVHANSMMGGTIFIKRTIDITGDTTLDLAASLAKLAGTVVEAETRRPLADASVWLEGETGGTATTDSTGRFAIENLESRAYHLSARKPAYQTASTDVTASEESDVVVELRRGEGIGITARDGLHGTPLRSVYVRVKDAQGATVFGDEIALDGQGRGEIPALAAGRYELRADASGYAPVTLPPITVPTAAVALSFTPGGHLIVQCGPETLGRPGANARLLKADGQLYAPWIYSKDGVIQLVNPVHRIENVVPGRYTLEVAGGPRPVVDVREGETATVTLP